MKFQDIEEAAIPEEEHVVHMYHNIYMNCQPFLKQIGDPSKNIMWRGIKYISRGMVHDLAELDVGIKDVRLGDRKPLDTDADDHQALNNYLNTMYGHPYRSALFATGAKHVAESYGTGEEPFAIFPIGDFDFLWHPQIGDFFGEFFDTGAYEDYKAEGVPADELVEIMFEEYFGPFNDDDLVEAIHSDHEIMVWVKKYYYMKPEYLPGFKAWLSK